MNAVEGELITRDAQHWSVSLGEVAEGEPTEIVPDAVFESRDDGHEGGGIDLRHADVNSEQGTLHRSDRGPGRHRSTLAMLFHVLQIPLFKVRLRPFRTAMAS